MHKTILRCFLAFAAPAIALAVPELDSTFPGWMGEIARSELLPDGTHRWMEVLSWPDRLFIIHNLITPEEADYFIDRAKGRLVRSGVVDVSKGAGGHKISDVRTSSGTFFNRGETPIIAEIEERIAQWVMVEKGQAEGFQVLDYKETQEYRPHYDVFFTKDGLDNGGNRLLTILIYLSDVEEGGETVFPDIAAPAAQTPEHFSECAMKGMAVKPRKGDAAVFWSLKTTGEVNKGSRHGSCPVIKGEKFSATKWYHVGHYAMPGERAEHIEHTVFVPPPPPAIPGCKDLDEDKCQGWAQGGECDRNSAFMVGTIDRPGSCLVSCGRCDLVAHKNTNEIQTYQ